MNNIYSTNAFALTLLCANNISHNLYFISTELFSKHKNIFRQCFIVYR